MFVGGDHGVKGQGDGWILTIVLLEGVNISSSDSVGSSDPCVVFTCNGKKRTSSVELQTHEPQWNGKAFFPCLLSSIIKDEILPSQCGLFIYYFILPE